MSLASLVVELSMGMARFESDSGKAAQIVSRDSEKMSRTARAVTESFEKQQAAMGRSAVEALAYQAAQAGVGDVARKLVSDMDRASAATAAAAATLAGTMGANASAAQSFSDKQKELNRQQLLSMLELDSAYKKTRATIESKGKSGEISSDQLKAQLAGLSEYRKASLLRLDDERNQQLAALQTAKMVAEATQATGAYGRAALASGKQIGLNTNQLQTLKYTISDVTASLGSGASPFTVLLQQGGQVAQIEGGLGGIFRGLVQEITPFRLAAGGAGIAVGALAYAMYEGAQQSKAYADAIVLSGNYAGLTEGKFNATVRAIASTCEVTAGAAREIGQALIATGQIGPQTFDKAAEAAARYAQATGKSAKEVADVFVKLAQDPAKAAAELNQTLNFLTASQLQQIRTLQEGGKSAEAQAIALDALNGRFKQLEPNLGTLDKLLRGVSSTWSGFWDAAFDIGRTETLEEKIKKAEDAASSLRKRLTDGRSANPAFSSAPPLRDDPSANPAERARIELLAGQKTDDAVELKRLKVLADNVAANKAETSALDKKAIAAADYYREAEKGAKAQTGLVRELAEEQRKYDDLVKRKQTDPSLELPSDATRKAIQKKIRESYTDKGGVNDADAKRKALLDEDLKFLKDKLQQEQEALAFNQQYLQGVYSASQISLKDYYAEKRAVIEKGVQEELNVLTNEQDRLEVELKRGGFKSADERTRTETQLAESVAKSAKVQRDARRSVILANQEEEASTKALNDRITEYRANLLQSTGDEAGAAAIRAQTVIANAKNLAMQAGGSISPEDLALQAKTLAQANEYAEIQRKLGLATTDASRAEEFAALRAQQDGAGLIDTERSIYAIRARALLQLGELRDKAEELADATKNKQIQQFAADLSLNYAKAAQAVDPSIQRLKSGSDELATSFANTFADSLLNARSFRDEVDALAKSLAQIGTKVLFTEPFEKSLKNLFSSGIDSGGGVGDFLRNLVGAPSAQKADYSNEGRNYASQITEIVTEQGAQTTAISASTTAISSMTFAADAAAQALANVSSSSGGAKLNLSGIFGGGGSDPNYSHEGLNYVQQADGTNYVPFDGFKASLHKGEAIVPAKYNPAANGGGNSSGGGVNVIIQNLPGQTVQQTRRANPKGGTDLIYQIKEAVKADMIRDVQDGGPFMGALQGQTGLSRSAGLVR